MNESKSSLNISDVPVDTKLSDTTKINASTSSSELYILYHESEIKHNETAYRTFIWLVWAGFLVIILGIVGCFLDKITPGIIISVSGILTEFISGCVIIYLDKSTKSKQEYYKQLSFDEEHAKILEAISQIKSEDQKIAILTKLVDNYCSRRK